MRNGKIVNRRLKIPSGRQLVDVLKAGLGGLVLASAKRHAGIETNDGDILPVGLDEDAGADEFRLEVATIGELPVLVGNLRLGDLGRFADHLQRLLKRRARRCDLCGILGENPHFRTRLLDIAIGRQNQIPSIEDLEEGIDESFLDQTKDFGHVRLARTYAP